MVNETTTKSPITAEEIAEIKRKCQIGDKIRVFNSWRVDFSGVKNKYGEWETSRIVRKFPHTVLLENGRYVDYVEIAMQRRENSE